MTATQPLQGRSRERVEQILLAAFELIDESATTDALTTTAIAVRTDMSVATVYRYFDDKHAIIVALLDRELEQIHLAIFRELGERETVTVDDIVELLLAVTLQYFRGSHAAVLLWHETRGAPRVAQHVAAQLDEFAEWLNNSALSAELIRTDAPDWAVEPIVWLADQTFNYVFHRRREVEEQQLIVNSVRLMLSAQVRRSATGRGISGIPANEFAVAAAKALQEIRSRNGVGRR